MTKRRQDGRETWNRLLEWDKGQADSERLAVTLIASDGYQCVDPSHPLGGKDGQKDAMVIKDNLNLVLAVYFPRGQKSFTEIKNKLSNDLTGISSNNADGLVFVTNQELRLNERSTLQGLESNYPIEIYHLERLTTLLNVPQNYGIRLEFLDITMEPEELIALYSQRDKEHLAQLTAVTEALEKATERLIGYTTGGDSFPKVFIETPLLSKHEGLEVRMTIDGKYPLYNTKLEISYLEDNSPKYKDDGTPDTDSLIKHLAQKQHFKIGDLTPNYAQLIGYISPPPSLPAMASICTYAQNGVFQQFSRLEKRDDGMIQTQTIRITNDPFLENILHEWERTNKTSSS